MSNVLKWIISPDIQDLTKLDCSGTKLQRIKVQLKLSSLQQNWNFKDCERCSRGQKVLRMNIRPFTTKTKLFVSSTQFCKTLLLVFHWDYRNLCIFSVPDVFYVGPNCMWYIFAYSVLFCFMHSIWKIHNEEGMQKVHQVSTLCKLPL